MCMTNRHVTRIKIILCCSKVSLGRCKSDIFSVPLKLPLFAQSAWCLQNFSKWKTQSPRWKLFGVIRSTVNLLILGARVCSSAESSSALTRLGHQWHENVPQIVETVFWTNWDEDWLCLLSADSAGLMGRLNFETFDIWKLFNYILNYEYYDP